LPFRLSHLTIRQVAEIAGILEGKRLKADFWVLTSSLTRSWPDRMGHLQTIQRAGGCVVADTCIDVPPCWRPITG
jgi:predicted aconitase